MDMWLPNTFSSACSARRQWRKRPRRHSLHGLRSQGHFGQLRGLSHKGSSHSILTQNLTLTFQSIPNFNDLLGVVSSLFASWFTYGISGIFWLFMNKGKWFSTPSKAFLTLVNWSLIIMAAAICGIGLYASGMAIYTSDGKGGAWSCKSASAEG